MCWLSLMLKIIVLTASIIVDGGIYKLDFAKIYGKLVFEFL